MSPFRYGKVPGAEVVDVPTTFTWAKLKTLLSRAVWESSADEELCVCLSEYCSPLSASARDLWMGLGGVL